MEITFIRIPNGNRVYLFDNVFPDNLLKQLTDICNKFSPESLEWEPMAWTTNRYAFRDNKYLNLLLHDFYQEIFSRDMMSTLNYKLHHASTSLYLDLPGLGNLEPHTEGPEGGTYLMQTYITDQCEPFNGTTVYTDDKQILFQMPYRNNFGWLFDQATGIMHGRHSDVSPNLKRFSIMTRFI